MQTNINGSFDAKSLEEVTNKSKKDTVFILGDSMVKHINDYLLTRNIKHEYLVKVRPFNAAKVRCLYDHSKPTMRDFDPEVIILHVGTNDLTSSKTSSEIAKSIIDLACSLKTNTNKIVISLIVPRRDDTLLGNKASEVNDRLKHMCTNRDIPYIDHTESIDIDSHIVDAGLHLNRSGSTVMARNFANYLSNMQ